MIGGCLFADSHQKSKTNIRFYVQDTGVGVRLKDQELLFNPYLQLRDGRSQGMGGTGLGLALVKQLVSKHEGTVSVVSCRNVGTRFNIDIPFDVVAPQCIPAGMMEDSPTEASKVEDVGSAYSGRALVVDDMLLIRTALSGLFHGYGLRCDVAPDGATAVKKLKAARGAYSFVLMDNEMGMGMNGPETVRAIRQFDTDTPIYGLTGHVMTEDRQKFQEAGVLAVYGKPISEEQISGLLETHCKNNVRHLSSSYRLTAPRHRLNAPRHRLNDIYLLQPTSIFKLPLLQQVDLCRKDFVWKSFCF